MMGAHSLTESKQTPNTAEYYPGDTHRVLTSGVKRETTLTCS